MATSVHAARSSVTGLVPAAGYVRVSTGKQAKKLSPEAQARGQTQLPIEKIVAKRKDRFEIPA